MTLEVGMTLWNAGSGQLSKIAITRVTATQAVARVNERVELRFDREQKDGCGFFERGDHSWHRTVFYVCDEKSDAIFEPKLKRRELLMALDAIELRKLPTEKIERIIKIAQE